MRYIGLPWGWALVRKHTTPGSGTGARGLCRNTKPVARKSKLESDYRFFKCAAHNNAQCIEFSYHMWYEYPALPQPPQPCTVLRCQNRGGSTGIFIHQLRA